MWYLVRWSVILSNYYFSIFKNRHLERSDLPDLNVTGAWKLGYTGRGRVVTFLDDGLEYDHPDLQENYVCLY